MAGFWQRVGQSSQGSSQTLVETDSVYFTRHSSFIVGLVVLLSSLAGHTIDILTYIFGTAAIVASISTVSPHDVSGHQQLSIFLGCFFGAVFTCMTYVMIHQLSTQYRSRFLRVTDPSLGAGKIAYPKTMDMVSWLIKELLHTFPLIVAFLSVGTTFSWFWNWENPPSNNLGWAITFDLFVSIVVYLCGPVLFLKAFHFFENSKHEKMLDEIRDISTQKVRDTIAPPSQRPALAAPSQQKAIAAPKQQSKPTQMPSLPMRADTQNMATKTPTASNQAMFVSKHPAGQLQPASHASTGSYELDWEDTLN